MWRLAVVAIEDLAPRFSWIQVLHGPASRTTGHVVWLGLPEGDDDVHHILYVLGLRARFVIFGLDLFCARAVRVSVFDTICAHAGVRERRVILLSDGGPRVIRLDGVQYCVGFLVRESFVVGVCRVSLSDTFDRRGLRALRARGLREAFQGIAA